MSDPMHRDPRGPQLSAAPATNNNRRRFLMLGASAAGAVAAAPVLATPAALVDAAGPDAKSQGYQETAHVRNYYATTRI